jgi:hypothetical protein
LSDAHRISLSLSTTCPAFAEKLMPSTMSSGGSFWISALTAVRTIAPLVPSLARADSVVIRAAMVTPFGDTRS